MKRYAVTYRARAYTIFYVMAEGQLDAQIEAHHTFVAPDMPESMNGVIELDDNWKIDTVVETDWDS